MASSPLDPGDRKVLLMFVAESLAKSARVASSCKTGHSEVESNHGRVTGECSGDCPKGKLIGCAFLVSIAEAVAVLIFRTESGCFGIVHAVLHRSEEHTS